MLPGESFRSVCPGSSRRGFLRAGSLGLGSLTLSQLPARQAEAAPARRTSVILFWMAGGPSHLDMVDMKPDAPAEVRGPFRPIATPVAGLQVCELLPGHARVARELAVIRSLHHEHSVHDDASHWVQTGYPLLNARARGQTHPAQGSVVARLRGAGPEGLPPYVCIPEAYRTHMGFYQTAAFLGARHNPLDAGGDPALGNYRPAEFTAPRSFQPERLRRRRTLLAAVDASLARVERAAGAGELSVVQQAAFQLVLGSRAREAFDLEREPAGLRDRYGRHASGQSALLARRLVEAGVSFVTVNLYEKDVDWWDDHYVIEKNLRKRLPLFDQAFSVLIEDLRDRGLLADTLVLAVGEFGRAPRIDQHAGRGHWPRAMHAVLAGGGVRGGQVIGATTSDGGEPATDPHTPGDLLASVYRVLGIPPTTHLTDREGRPVAIVPEGEPIESLFF